jgi:hypothetical protein
MKPKGAYQAKTEATDSLLLTPKQCDVLAITNQYCTRLGANVPRRSLPNSLGISGEIPGRGRRAAITDLEHSY